MALHLVTGGNGYLGSFIARELAARGERVRSVDITHDASTHPLIEKVICNITDGTRMSELMLNVQYVHHNAALVPLRKAGDEFAIVNIQGTRLTLDAALAAGVLHFSHMSSSAVYGRVEASMCPLTAAHLPEPVEIYGQSKLEGERLVLAAAENGNMSCSVIRPRTIIGPERLGIFQILFEWISEGRRIYIIGDGSNMFQFAHVNDLVDVSIETALRRISGIFNIGTDRFDTLRNTLQGLCDHANTGSRVTGTPVILATSALWAADKLGVSPLAPYHYLTYHKPYYFDLTNEFRQLQWRPKYSNLEMLKSSYQWYIEHCEMLKTSSGTSTHRGTLKQGVIGLLKKIS